MISYRFTENELKYLCAVKHIKALCQHQFHDSPLDESSIKTTVKSLEGKSFIEVRDDKVIINKGISMLIDVLSSPQCLYIGDGERKFTAYIANNCSVLLINEKSSSVILLCPFPNETELEHWLRANGFFEWRIILSEE